MRITVDPEDVHPVADVYFVGYLYHTTVVLGWDQENIQLEDSITATLTNSIQELMKMKRQPLIPFYEISQIII